MPYPELSIAGHIASFASATARYPKYVANCKGEINLLGKAGKASLPFQNGVSSWF